MDPNASLAMLRELVQQVLQTYYSADERDVMPDDAGDLAEVFDNLDKWLTKGGFLPQNWRSEHPAPASSILVASDGSGVQVDIGLADNTGNMLSRLTLWPSAARRVAIKLLEQADVSDAEQRRRGGVSK